MRKTTMSRIVDYHRKVFLKLGGTLVVGEPPRLDPEESDRMHDQMREHLSICAEQDPELCLWSDLQSWADEMDRIIDSFQSIGSDWCPFDSSDESRVEDLIESLLTSGDAYRTKVGLVISDVIDQPWRREVYFTVA